MKNIFSTLLFVLTVFISLKVQSQNPDRFPMLRERIAQVTLHEIRLSLNLDQSTFVQFQPIYLKYEREVSGINIRNMVRLMKVDADSLSTDEADRLILSQLESAKKLIMIREKYYSEFRTVLTPQQIIKLYQTEEEIRKKVVHELKRRMMSR